ncbi:hypothetical protein [Arthrobacter sp. IK3]|uniref:hypothetical protein n=1 Tax=Arthrobacter sp. IK3 TaxID=3448169 RepID=UPI003EE07F7D
MTAIIIIAFVWLSALAIYLPVNAYIAAGRKAGDQEAERMAAAAAAGGAIPPGN